MLKELNILKELQIKKGRIYGGFLLKEFEISEEEIKKYHEYDYHIFLMFHGEIAFLGQLIIDLNEKIKGEKIIYDIFNRYKFKANTVTMNNIKMDNNFFKIKITGKLYR